MAAWELTDKHFEVLEWVQDGCPERDDARALKARAAPLAALKLVKVLRQPWRAQLTELGAETLTRRHDPRPARAPKPKPAPPRMPPKPAVAKPAPPERRQPDPDVVAEVEAAGGSLLILRPDEPTRAAYRRAFHAATTMDRAPAGKRLRLSGRSSGDLRLWLEDDDSKERLERAAKLANRPAMPDFIEQPHKLVSRRIKAAQRRGKVADRKLRTTHLLATALEEAGYHVEGTELAPAATTDDDITVTLYVENQTDKVPDLDRKGEQRTDYAGRPQWKWLPNDKVSITDGHGYGKRTWSDRQRWTIADKVPEIVEYVDEVVTSTRERREEAERARRQRRAEWGAAVPRAKAAYQRAHNRERAQQQLERWSEARQWRAFAVDVATRAQGLDGEDREAVLAWAAWLNEQADHVDPACHPDQLRFDHADEERTWEVSKFMPHGWSVSYPPD